MSIKQMLACIFAENPKLPMQNRPRDRHVMCGVKNKRSFVQEHRHLSGSREDDGLIMAQKTATIMYVQSHHPSIKKRVCGMILQNKQANHSFSNTKVVDNIVRKRSYRCHSLRCQTDISCNPIISFSLEQKICHDSAVMDRMDVFQAFISKPCKITPSTIVSRSLKSSSFRPHSCKGPPHKQLHTQNITSPSRRTQTANCHNRAKTKSNYSFRGWEGQGGEQEIFIR